MLRIGALVAWLSDGSLTDQVASAKRQRQRQQDQRQAAELAQPAAELLAQRIGKKTEALKATFDCPHAVTSFRRGGSEFRNVARRGRSTAARTQAHPRINKLPVSLRAGSSVGTPQCSVREPQLGYVPCTAEALAFGVKRWTEPRVASPRAVARVGEQRAGCGVLPRFHAPHPTPPDHSGSALARGEGAGGHCATWRNDRDQPSTSTMRWSASAVVSWSCTMATRM